MVWIAMSTCLHRRRRRRRTTRRPSSMAHTAPPCRTTTSAWAPPPSHRIKRATWPRRRPLCLLISRRRRKLELLLLLRRLARPRRCKKVLTCTMIQSTKTCMCKKVLAYNNLGKHRNIVPFEFTNERTWLAVFIKDVIFQCYRTTFHYNVLVPLKNRVLCCKPTTTIYKPVASYQIIY